MDVQTGLEVGRVKLPGDAGFGYGPKLGAFSADGKTVVTNFGVLGRWNLSTGKAVFEPDGGGGLGGPVEHLAFTPDGKQVFAQGWFTDAAVWDAATGKRTAYRRERAGCQIVSTPDGLRSVWADHVHNGHEIQVFDTVAGTKLPLVTWTAPKEVGVDGIKAYALAADSPAAERAAVLRAVADGEASVKALAAAFDPPAAKPDAEISALIAALDDDDFAAREAASRKLKAVGATANQQLRLSMRQSKSAEVRRRLAEVVAGLPVPPLKLPPSDDTLRGVRAVEVLERVETPAARALLAKWADQSSDPRLAAEAVAALGRVPRHPPGQ